MSPLISIYKMIFYHCIIPSLFFPNYLLIKILFKLSSIIQKLSDKQKLSNFILERLLLVDSMIRFPMISNFYLNNQIFLIYINRV